MPSWNNLPTWSDLAHSAESYGSLMGIDRHDARFRHHYYGRDESHDVHPKHRVECVKRAFWDANSEAAVGIKQRFSDLAIREVVGDLVDSATELARILAASTLIGGVIGGAAGSWFAGVGALPGSVAGSALGLKAGGWILSLYGLSALAEHLVDGMPDIARLYQRGVKRAWNAPSPDHWRPGHIQIDAFAIHSATVDIAKGHEETVVLLLRAIIAHLTRHGGGAAGLMQQMRKTPRGERLAAWVAKHEHALKQHPLLKVPEPVMAMSGGPIRHEAAPASRPATGRGESSIHARRARRMARVEVPCFSAKRMPHSKIPEFDRQLVGQEKGLNALTIQEYVTGRAAFTSGDVKREPGRARVARNRYKREIQERQAQEFMANGMSPSQASDLANIMALEKMNTLSALHNPDLIGGGLDVISDFGDRQVNSSIGPQWKSRVKHLDDAVQNYLDSHGSSDLYEMKKELMSASLTRCQ